MANILIRGMEMPKNCHNCELLTRIGVTHGNVYACQILNEVIGNVMVRQINCPLVELPPHGRLIDADALLAEDDGYYTQFGYSPDKIRDALTIIPAEGGSEDG